MQPNCAVLLAIPSPLINVHLKPCVPSWPSSFFFSYQSHDIPEFIHSPIEGHLGHFQTLAITNKTALNICVDFAGVRVGVGGGGGENGFGCLGVDIKEHSCLYGKSVLSVVRTIQTGFQRIGTIREQCQSKWCYVFNFKFYLFISLCRKQLSLAY